MTTTTDDRTTRGEESGEQSRGERRRTDWDKVSQQAKKEKDLSGAVDSIIRFRIRIRGHYLSAGQIPASLLAGTSHITNPLRCKNYLISVITSRSRTNEQTTNDEIISFDSISLHPHRPPWIGRLNVCIPLPKFYFNRIFVSLSTYPLSRPPPNYTVSVSVNE